MYGLEYGKGHVHCSFCGARGHNITSCKWVAEKYKNTLYDLRLTLEKREHRPWVLIKNWYRLSRREQMAWLEMKNREKRQAKRRSRKLSREKPRCSFCRKEGHKRPSCKHHKKFSKRVYKANAIWRKQFAELVNNTGFGIGSLLEIPKSFVYWYAGQGEKLNCLLVGYTLDSLNVFSSYKHRSDFKTTPSMLLMENTTGQEIKVGFNKVKPFVDSGLAYSGWRSGAIRVISPTTWTPPEDWSHSSNVEVDFVLKKVSVSSDAFPLIYEFINTWIKGDSQ
tara:strand:- start:448 stop:1284 length:837 start_codon:yes stop_codon:yes gene_type:complete